MSVLHKRCLMLIAYDLLRSFLDFREDPQDGQALDGGARDSG